MIIDGSKLMQNHLTPIVKSDNKSNKSNPVTSNNINKSNPVTSSENISEKEDKPKLLPKRKGEKIFAVKTIFQLFF